VKRLTIAAEVVNGHDDYFLRIARALQRRHTTGNNDTLCNNDTHVYNHDNFVKIDPSNRND